MSPEAGVVIRGRYSLEREIARGGMGALWRARDRELGRRVAIKFLAVPPAKAAEARERFEQEARATASLRSPHVIQVHDYGTEQGLTFIVMELLEGEDLRARIDRAHRLPLGATATIVEQTVRALEVIHGAGMIHRDLKPGNVFLARVDGREAVKVIDFGVVKMSDGERCVTRRGIVLGTPRYMSPEQMEGREDLDHRCDLWALAVIAYRAITGENAFSGKSAKEIMRSVLTRPAPLPSALVPELSPEVDAFFARALAPSLEARFASAREMAEAFAEVCRGAGRATLRWPSARSEAADISTPRAQSAGSRVGATEDRALSEVTQLSSASSASQASRERFPPRHPKRIGVESTFRMKRPAEIRRTGSESGQRKGGRSGSESG